MIMDSITENQNIYVLSSDPPESKRTLTVVSACFGTQMEQTAALFSMKNPGAILHFLALTLNYPGLSPEQTTMYTPPI